MGACSQLFTIAFLFQGSKGSNRPSPTICFADPRVGKLGPASARAGDGWAALGLLQAAKGVRHQGRAGEP